MDISFVIPVYNEQDSVAELCASIVRQMREISDRYEIIFVDDGSIDNSFAVLERLGRQDEKIKIIKFRKNFGKSISLNEGFRHAEGDIVITLDSDLQDDPGEIPEFISKIKEGYDLVCGWKQQRQDPFLSKNLPSKLFNSMVNVISGLKLHDHNCGFKALKKDVAKEITLYGDHHRFVPAIAASMGFRVAEIPITHRARLFGRSKFGVNRFYRGLFDFLTIFFLTIYLKRPMHLFGWFGFLFSTLGFVICAYLSIIWLQGEQIGGRPLLILGVLLILVGIQFISTGLIAELISYGNRANLNNGVIENVIQGRKHNEQQFRS